MTGGSANRRRRQSEGTHHAGESRWPRKQQMNPAGTTRIRFRKVSAFPDSFLTPHRSPQNEGRTEVESVNARLRKIIKTRGHFPTDDAASKLIWLALRNITADWGKAAHNWKAAMNRFAILYDDRFNLAG